MATNVSQDELARRWAERVQSGKFSSAVIGVGTIRVMGKSGDAPVSFPRITSLAALGQLAPDEQWAVRMAQEIVNQAQTHDRRVLSVQPATEGQLPTPTPITTFDTAAESLVVVSMIRGG